MLVNNKLMLRSPLCIIICLTIQFFYQLSEIKIRAFNHVKKKTYRAQGFGTIAIKFNVKLPWKE